MRYLVLAVLFFCRLFPAYGDGDQYVEGDQILEDDQNLEFSYCYPEDSTGTTFSLAKNSGKVFLLEMSASWWGPCYSAIPEGEEIYEHWTDDERVEIIHFLDDLNDPPIQYGPKSCKDWGKAGILDIPPIINDGASNTVFNWFTNPNGTGIYPLIVFINHELVVRRIMGTGPSPTMANLIIDNMLGDLSPLTNLNEPVEINSFSLTRLYPNPFNPVLNIDFEINQAGWVKVNITDITGSMVKTVYEGFEGVGKHQISWDSETLPSGTYFVTLELNEFLKTKKVVLLK